MLIKPVFEDPIDTEYDVLKRSLGVMVPGNTSLETLIKIDPRPSMKMLQKHTKLYKPEFELPSFVKEGYYSNKKLKGKNQSENNYPG